jgi:hypothetical protein
MIIRPSLAQSIAGKTHPLSDRDNDDDGLVVPVTSRYHHNRDGELLSAFILESLIYFLLN